MGFFALFVTPFEPDIVERRESLSAIWMCVVAEQNKREI
jgi:hypothetical protein